jgi:hypothetical protein
MSDRLIEFASRPRVPSRPAEEIYAGLRAADAVRSLIFVAALSSENDHGGGLGPALRDARIAAALVAPAAEWDTVLSAERRAQAALLRCCFGNPFHPLARPANLPGAVLELADALLEGENCHSALADTLREVGLASLAEHFREPQHPKSCWALKVIRESPRSTPGVGQVVK